MCFIYVYFCNYKMDNPICVGNSNPVLDLQTDNIFDGKDAVKIIKFLDYIESRVIGRYLRLRHIYLLINPEF